jgi:hypothetical protein
VPVKVIVAVPVAAVAEAVNVRLCAVPGVRLRDEGLAVTPAGRPVIATETVPEKELAAVARTCTGAPVPPGVKLRDVGERVSEKSGGCETVRATVAVCFSVPDEPVKVIVAVPAVAAAEAVKVRF